MRFVWSVLAFVLAAVSFAAGVAQRTVFLGPDSVEQSVSITEEQPYLVIDAEAFALQPGTQTLRVAGSGTLFSAVGTTTDIEAWLSDQTYNRVSVEDGELVTSVVEPTADATDGTAGRNPAGSDLWIDQDTAEGELVTQEQLPDGMSMLIAVDGTQPAPSDVVLSWPLDQRTPWFGPLIVLGSVLLLVGIVLYVLAIRYTRHRRGPIRKSLPALPEDPSVGAPDLEDGSAAGKGVISSGRRRRALRRTMTAIPAIGLSAVLLAGCTQDSWPQFGSSASPTPTPTPTATVSSEQSPSTLTEAQAERILAEISDTVAQADEAADADAAAQRLSGLALKAREVNYTLRQSIADYAAPAAIPTGTPDVVLPQATDTWPRTALVIIADDADETVAPTILSMTQEDPWSAYVVDYLGSLEASAETPELAPVWLGAPLVALDSPFLSVAPEDLAAAYADVIGNGEQSEYASLFDIDTDGFLAANAERRQQTLDTFNETGSETGSLEFLQQANPQEPVALASLDSGAIVAVAVDETDRLRATDSDAAIKWEDDDVIIALTGEKQSETGVDTNYTDQLFFFVPAEGSDEKVRLLGYSSSIQGATLADSSEEDAGTDDGTAEGQ